MLAGVLAGVILAAGQMLPADGSQWDPWGFAPGASEPAGAPGPEALKPHEPMIGVLFRFYRDFVSPVNGSNCPMNPSCSRYSRLALERLGTLEGMLATFDRLHRCGHDLRFYELVLDGGRWLRFDPPGGSEGGF